MRGILVWRPWRLLVTLLVAWALPRAAMADLNGEMNTMFGSMATATPPSLFATARRGVIAGGSLAVRNPIVNTNLVSITPPGFKAGCGGIDFFGGSFSFINAAQFQALLKAIAANAAGYAFELAMNYMCPGCMSTIETLARKIQDWISKFSNSCLMAQGLVNDTVAAATNTTNNKASVLGMLDGVKQDAFDAWTNLTSPSPVSSLLAGAPATAAKSLQGNVTWRALVKQNAVSWFGSGDSNLLQMLMNIGGTVIVGNLTDDSEGTGSQDLNLQTIIGRPDLLTSMINGGTFTIMVCDTTDQDGCLAPTSGSVTLVGFQQMIVQAFEGSATSTGIIAKVADGVPLTSAEQAALGFLPDGLGGLVIRLSAKSRDAATALVDSAAPQIAGLMAKSLVDGMLRAVRASISASTDAHAKDVEKLLQESWTAVRAEELAHQSLYGSLPQVVASYTSLMGVTMPPSSTFMSALNGAGKKN